jgi:hypothetical protein
MFYPSRSIIFLNTEILTGERKKNNCNFWIFTCTQNIIAWVDKDCSMLYLHLQLHIEYRNIDGWLRGRWVAKLSGSESRHLSKILNGWHKQRNGQHTTARLKKEKEYFSPPPPPWLTTLCLEVSHRPPVVGGHQHCKNWCDIRFLRRL